LGCWHGGAANGFTDAGSAHRLGLSPNSFRGKAGARDLMGREYAVVAWPWSRPNSRTRAQADPEFARQVLRRHGDEQVGDRSIRELIATSLPCFSAVADIGLVSATGPRNLN